MKKTILLLLLLVLAQGLFIYRVFPVYQLDPGTPILINDFSIHHYQTEQMLYLLKHFGKVSGYDPFFMAGYPGVVVNLTDNYGVAFTLGLLSMWLPLAIAEKLFLIGMLFLFPIIIYLAAVCLGLSRSQSFLAGILLVVVMQYHEYYRSLMNWGLYSFVISIFLSILWFSLIVRYFKERSRRKWLAALLVGAYTVSVHPLSVPMFLSFLGPYLIFDAKKLTRRFFNGLLVMMLLIVLANSYWIVPLLLHSGYYHQEAIYQKAFGFEKFIKDLMSVDQAIFHILMVLSVIGTLISLRKKKIEAPVVLALWCAFFIFYGISYFGEHSLVQNYFSHIEPARFITAAVFLIPLLTVYGISGWGEERIRNLAVLLIFSMIAMQAYCLSSIQHQDNCTASRIKRVLCGNMCQPTEWGKDIMAEGGDRLVRRIREVTDPSARILLEDHIWDFVYWDSRLPALMSMLTERSYIGGPFPHLSTKYNFANFSSGMIFGRAIQEIPIGELMEYMKLYNVGWAVIHSPEATRYFQMHGVRFRFLGKVPGPEGWEFRFYRVASERNYFVRGKGKVTMEWNELKLSGLSEGEIILKFHYARDLRTKPPVLIQKVDYLDDPMGFIRLENREGYDTIRITQ
ncbi:MAG: hypothetical protein JW893_04630 [Candidatus Omnitrophica bacterium]|nr:hypothetical protein [Candidatus Omnitrophota bacterium]